jgi:hypothetical protein
MNPKKLSQLFSAARKQSPPEPDPGFEGRALSAIRREASLEPVTLFDQLGALFPKLGLAAALVIGLCVAGDYWGSAQEGHSLNAGIAELSEQWLFAAESF